ncbi:hypothetical protein ACH3XW_13875 [Acanthocheilonema viteae]
MLRYFVGVIRQAFGINEMTFQWLIMRSVPHGTRKHIWRLFRWSKDLVLEKEMLHCWITSILFILGFISISANCNLQSDRFDRQDRDYRPLQFGKRDGHRPLQFGKKSFRPLQFGKRGVEEAPDYFY